ncbi:secretin [Shewanella waksmanii]|uniref:secretin n=1 Tax=Shewanella waksmanii TaxID=213783 RepID=UPI0037354F6B
MKSRVVFFLFFSIYFVPNCVADVLVSQNDMSVEEVILAIGKDAKLKVVDELEKDLSNQVVTQVVEGDAIELLTQLANIYSFDWYVYGGTLTVQSGKKFINYVYKPKNIQSEQLLNYLKDMFTVSDSIRISLVEKGELILLSGSESFIRDVIRYSDAIDTNHFLTTGNNLQIARINFDFLPVNDRQVESYDGTVLFPGAKSLILNALNNIGQFDNVNDSDVLQKSYRLKLSEGNKQQLEEDEDTSKVQVLPEFNALLIRGTPEEVELAKRISKLIDIKSSLILFSVSVQDIAVERTELLGLSNSWLGGGMLGDIVVPPFTTTSSFLKNIQALYTNNLASSVYETKILVLENHQGYFGKKESVTLSLISNKEVSTQIVEAENSLNITGRILPSGDVRAKLGYKEESLDDTGQNKNESGSDISKAPKVTSQSLLSEVYIRPGETVILGGFNNTVSETQESGVPLLSDIPLLGEIFKTKKEIKRKFKRYVAISFEVVE